MNGRNGVVAAIETRDISTEKWRGSQEGEQA